MVNNFTDHGNAYAGFILNLSKSIAGNSINFDKLVALYDHFTKELQGRVEDLKKINDVYYNEVKEDEYSDGKTPFLTLKNKVNDRHDEISKAVKGDNNDNNEDKEKKDEENDDNKNDEDNNKEDEDNSTKKVKEIYEGLINSNQEYNELVIDSSSKYDTSQNEKARLVSEFYTRYQSVEQLIQKINGLPSLKVDLDAPEDIPDDNPNADEPDEI